MGPTPAILERSSKQLLPTNAAVGLGDHAEEAGVRKHSGQNVQGYIRRRKVRWEAMINVDPVERW